MSSWPTEPAAELVDVVMPQLGVSVAEGTVVGWHKAIGDPVAADEPLCEVSTDKVDSDLPSPADGVVRELLVEVGTVVEVGAVLARLAPARATAATAPAASASAGAATPAPGPSHARRSSPVVRRIAAAHGIDLATVAGTGRGGRISRRDVLAVVERGAAPASARSAPLSRMRTAIGEHMRRSLDTAAHCTTIVEADMSGVEAVRRRLGLTYLPVVAACVAEALGEFPMLNATLEDGVLTEHGDVHLGVAVSLGADGLIVPVVPRAQALSAAQLGERIADLAARARAGALAPDEVRGATFTITNPGAFGAVIATPIINQPQVAILDLEAVVRRPVVVADGHGGEAIAIRPIACLCLSWDHRALDGALAAQFLSAVVRRIESLR